MRFNDLGIKSKYTSETNSVYHDFFNEVLKNSSKYCRFGGLFSSKKFVQCADGIQEFLNENDGEMYLVIIPIFDKKDIDALKTESKMKVITNQWKIEIDKIKDVLEQDHVKALAWMIAHDRLKVKLIIPEHENGTPLSKEELNDVDEFRNEVGIFFNKEDSNPLSFKGNINFENEQFPDGYVDIRTSRMWVDSEEDHIEEEYTKFNNFWENDSYEIGNIKCKIEPLKDELLTYFEETSPPIPPKILKKLPKLFDYQEDARDAYIENEGVGIFEMGTGTGKTFTALGCIKKIQEKNEKLLVVIAVPYTNLVNQWQQESKKWYFEPSAIILDGKGWIGNLRDLIRDFNKDQNHESIKILICTHAKFSRQELIDEIKKSKMPTMLIVDEAHHVGSGNTEKDDDGVQSVEGSRKGLTDYYKYRLALSATINRHHDDEGTNILRKYFTSSKGIDTVYEYTLERAIKEKKLCEYYYYPYFVNLTPKEFDEYVEITIRAVRMLSNKDPIIRTKGEDLIKKRALKIRDASEKINKFPEIVKDLIEKLDNDLRHLLIFCSENQYEDLENILDDPERNFNYKNRIDHVRITYKDPPNKEDRVKILEEFKDEKWHTILSNRVLDEGMDVPQAKCCIILASTTNPAQFIQRRGRVLRTMSGHYKDGSKKKYAYIFDLLVRPDIDGIEKVSKNLKYTIEDIQNAKKYEIKIIRNQLEKIETMTRLAKNRSKCEKKINEFKHDLPDECFIFEK